MPYLSIKLSVPAAAQTSAKVAERLTALTAEILGKKRELTSVAVDYVARVFADMETLFGPLHPASYIVIHDVGADAWDYQGRTQEFRYIQGRPT